MIKVLVVEDSAFMRQIFKKTLNEEPNIKVVGTAYNGKNALAKIPKLNPDVITLDIEMPIKSGMETLEEIIKLKEPPPVIIVSALDNKDTVMKALEIGAFDFIAKPSGKISLSIEEIKEKLKDKIKAAAKSENKTKQSKKPQKTISKKFSPKNKKQFPIIAIGSSSGGPKALNKLLPVFPENFPAGFIIVQHMPAGFTESLADRLNSTCNITVKEAEENDRIKSSHALLAPGDFHLTINKEKKIQLNQKPKKWGVRPCVDYTMSSAAKIYRERVIGIILTGMGHDGASGMIDIKKYNGYGIVEDKSTALVYGMPSATIKAGAYDKILPLDEIGLFIRDVIERRY